jgi:hypothetical protein
VRAALLAAAALAALLLPAGCGGGSPRLQAASPGVAKRLMTARLNAKHLDYRWVACVRVGRTYTHVPITRCNVNFGIDPHIEAYCLLLKDGKLVTSHDDPAIPCAHDDAGWDRTTIVHSSS